MQSKAAEREVCTSVLLETEMRKHVGPGDAAPPVQTSLALVQSQSREKGLLPDGNFTPFAPLSMAFAHFQQHSGTWEGCVAWRRRSSWGGAR